MKYRNIKLLYALMLSLIMGTTSCTDLDVDPIDPGVIQTFEQDDVFAKIYATLGLTGQQAPAGIGDVDGVDEGNSGFVRMIWNLNELSTDEAICAWTQDDGVPALNFNSWSSSHVWVKGLYGRFYFNITLCNFFLAQTEGAADAKTVKQRAEVRFMRALNYYYLLDMFENVPFTEVVSKVPPMPISRVNLFRYVANELRACEEDMSEPRQSPYYRANKAANWLLSARLYLNSNVYTGVAKWDSAAIYAKKVMDSPYSLHKPYAQLFVADNAGAFDGSTVNGAPQEIILPIAADGVKTFNYASSVFLVASTHTAGMPNWGSTEGWGGNRARAALVKKFFPTGVLPTNDSTILATQIPVLAGDDRAMFYGSGRPVFITTVSIFKEGLSVTKFSNVRADGKPSNDRQWVDMDVPFLRVSEAYLTYAEAVVRGAAPIGGETALTAINKVRDRANATTWTTITLDRMIDEWSREFYFEGRRRSDLIRFDRFGGGDYTWDWKGGVPDGTKFDKKYNIFPIPVSDLNANPNLSPTPGY